MAEPQLPKRISISELLPALLGREMYARLSYRAREAVMPADVCFLQILEAGCPPVPKVKPKPPLQPAYANEALPPTRQDVVVHRNTAQKAAALAQIILHNVVSKNMNASDTAARCGCSESTVRRVVSQYRANEHTRILGGQGSTTKEEDENAEG